MRARNIKPGIFKNEILGAADPLYTLVFQGLWLLADREGRLEDRPVRIRGELFPYRSIDLEPFLVWLTENEFICRYSVAGNSYIQINRFHKHQNPHKTEKPSVIPARSRESTKVLPLTNGSRPADSLIPDSSFTETLIPDSPIQPEALKTLSESRNRAAELHAIVSAIAQDHRTKESRR
jgi:hypothetical protein